MTVMDYDAVVKVVAALTICNLMDQDARGEEAISLHDLRQYQYGVVRFMGYSDGDAQLIAETAHNAVIAEIIQMVAPDKEGIVLAEVAKAFGLSVK